MTEQAFKLDFDPENLESLNNKETKDILECELTKTEFADVLTMKPDSLFVEQMFELVDQDNSGSISFREFLDVIVVFAKGKISQTRFTCNDTPCYIPGPSPMNDCKCYMRKRNGFLLS